ncbi:MAG TPA: hypothetical protein PLD55_13575 [bacterium]|nr:hypothetical protein [bacterium]
MVKEKRFRVDFQRYDAEFFEKAYEDSENFKKIPKKKERIENHKDEKPGGMYNLPGALYELPYAAFDEVCRAPDMKELTYDKFHPMLFYGYYHISEENSSTVRWFLGTSKLNAVNRKNNYMEQKGVKGFVFSLESKSISDHIKNRKYPLSDTFFLIHPQALFIYKFGNSPNDLSYKGNIGQQRLDQVKKHFSEIESELQKRSLL